MTRLIKFLGVYPERDARVGVPELTADRNHVGPAAISVEANVRRQSWNTSGRTPSGFSFAASAALQNARRTFRCPSGLPSRVAKTRSPSCE